MSTLGSQSSDADVWAAYDDNCSFEEDASLVKAQTFITACLILLRRRPLSTSFDGVSTSFDERGIQTALDRARSWVNQNAAANARPNRYLDISGIRD